MPKIDEEWVAQAKNELKTVVENYQALLPFLEEVSEAKVETRTARGVQTSTRRIVRFGQNCFIERGVSYADPAKQPSLTLDCDNADYHFSLSKPTPTAPFALTNYRKGERKQPLWNTSVGVSGEVFAHLQATLGVLLPENRSRLHSVRFDPGISRLTIEHGGSGELKKNVEQFIFDPKNGWTLTRRWVNTGKVTSSAEYSYEKTIDGVNLPTGAVLTSAQEAPHSSQHRIVVRVLELKRANKSPHDFRLSAFGLPEPTDVAPLSKPTPWYLWFLVASCLFGALGLGAAYLRRRLQSRSAP